MERPVTEPRHQTTLRLLVLIAVVGLILLAVASLGLVNPTQTPGAVL
jgi:hypothetical protein